jgi:hypothetical protein
MAMTRREFERRVKGGGLTEKPLPKIDPQPEQAATQSPQEDEGAASEPARRSGSGNGPIVALVLAIIAMGGYLAVNGVAPAAPSGAGQVASAAGSATTHAGALHRASHRAAIAPLHRSHPRRHGSRDEFAAIAPGYLGPSGEFSPGPGELTTDWWDRALGAWNGAADVVAERIDAAGYGDLRQRVDQELSEIIEDGLDFVGNSIAPFNTGESGTTIGVMGFGTPMMAGVGAFALVMVMCLGGGIYLATRGTRPGRTHVWRLNKPI